MPDDQAAVPDAGRRARGIGHRAGCYQALSAWTCRTFAGICENHWAEGRRSGEAERRRGGGAQKLRSAGNHVITSTGYSCWLTTTGYRLLTTDYRLPTTAYPPEADFAALNCQLPTARYYPQMITGKICEILGFQPFHSWLFHFQNLKFVQYPILHAQDNDV